MQGNKSLLSFIKEPENQFIFLFPLVYSLKKVCGLYKRTEFLEVTYFFFPDDTPKFNEKNPNKSQKDFVSFS